MRKLLSLALVIAMIISCISMVSFAAESKTVVEAGKLFIDFENESDVTENFAVFQAGTISLAEGKGKDGSAALKYADGTQSWHSPYLKNDIVKKVITETGSYVVSFDIFFEVLPASITTEGVCLGYRHAGDAAVTSIIDGSKEWQANTWYTVTRAIDFDITQENVRIFFDRFAPNTVAYIDNFSVEKAPAAVGVKFEVTETLKNAYGYFMKDKIYTADDVKDGKLTVSYDFYNPTDTAVRVNLWIQNNWTAIQDKIPTSRADAELAPQSKKTLTLELPVNADNKVVIDNATTAELSALRLRIQFDDLDASDKAAGTYFIVTAPEGDALYSLTSGTYYVKDTGTYSGKVAQTPVTEVPDLKEVTPAPTAEPTPTPVPVKKLENLNAEAGLVGGWGNIHGGSVELVQPGANKTGNAVKAVIAGKYQSLGYDFGPAILQDAEKGYAGAGAGVYTIKFWAKAEDGNEGMYKMYLNSVCHLNAGQVDELNLGLDTTENTYYPIGDIELYDEWEEYELEFELPESYLNEIYALAKSSHSLASEAYKIMLRFDGSPASFAYGEGEFFNYYVDELSITCPESGEDAKTPTGIIFEATGDAQLDYIVTDTSKGGAVSAEDVNDGEVTKTLIVKNLSDEDMAIEFSLQGHVTFDDGSATWASPDDAPAGMFEIPAGGIVEMEYTFAVNADGTVTIQGVDLPIGKLFYRLNFSPTEYAEGSKFAIYGDADALSLLNGVSKAGWKKTYTYDALPEGSGDAAPVALIATVAVAFVALAVVVAKKRRED